MGIKMKKVILYIAASLDGKIARTDGSIDWLPDPTAEDYGYKEFYDSIDTILMGHKTYETCLNFGDWGFKGKKTYVFSKNPRKKLIEEAELITEDPIQFVTNLKKSQGKDIWLIGGGKIIATLHDEGLIDEYILAIIPIILGVGIELFPTIKKEEKLQMKKHSVYENGVILTYFNKM